MKFASSWVLAIAVAATMAFADEVTFTAKPTVTRDGDRAVIGFAVSRACDATVAIEDGDGKIVRHLASGVLGANAPEPFQRNSLKQVIAWDGKDDQDRYVDNRNGLTVRVSLGLAPRFERTLFWDPRKRTSDSPLDWPTFRAAPEGVYVYDGGLAMDNVRLFDHEGNYVRTIYPFSAQTIDKVKGISWKTLQPDGARVPIRPNYQQTSLLTSGTNCETPAYDPARQQFRYPNQTKQVAHFGQMGKAATAMAVRDGRIALANLKLNRLASDGTTGGLDLEGPAVAFSGKKSFVQVGTGISWMGVEAVEEGGFSLGYLSPERAALAPGGKWLYLTRYAKTFFGYVSYARSHWDHVVMRVAFDGNEPMQMFLGEWHKPSDDNSHFNMPASVDCDDEGRLYIADHYNNRVQVFSPDGKFLQTIKVDQPAEVVIHRKTGEIYVFCWPLCVPNKLGYDVTRIRGEKPRYVVEKFSPLPKAQRLAVMGLPLEAVGVLTSNDLALRAEVDPWAEPTTIWLCPGVVDHKNVETLLLVERDNKLEIRRNLQAEAKEAVQRTSVASYHRQRLYVNPATGRLYVAEGSGSLDDGKTFQQLLEIELESGRMRTVDMPIAAEDMCFDLNGQVVLRSYAGLVRYDPQTWREIPFDYGEEMELRKQKIISAVRLPADEHWHQGGLWVSPRGRIAVGCLYDTKPEQRPRGQKNALMAGRKYAPRIYPGRNINYNYGAVYVHVWDEHGKLLYDDALPGLGGSHGLCIDGQDNLYVLAAGCRVLDGQPYFNPASCTLLKVPPKGARIISTAGCAVPISDSEKPTRSADLARTHGLAWVDGAFWLHGGIGWDGKKGIGCSCWNARITMDGYARTFAPEIDRNSIAVLDASGNLIVRVGRYGNVDDGKPLIAAGGPPNTRSIGGDEVSLVYGLYPATHSDRRLFVADAGNARIVSVKLGYHATERVPLR